MSDTWRQRGIDDGVGYTVATERSQWTFLSCNSVDTLHTRLDGRQAGEECDRIHNALLARKPTGFQDPSGSRMDNEHVKEESRQAGEVIVARGCVLLVAHAVLLVY